MDAETRYHFDRVFNHFRTLERMLVAMAEINQDNIDALAKELTDSNGRIRTEINTLEQSVDQLKTANPSLDTSSLDFSGLKAAIDDAASIVPEVADAATAPSEGTADTPPSAGGADTPPQQG